MGFSIGRRAMDRDGALHSSAPRFALVAAWPAWPTYNPATMRRRCHWARDPLDVAYHDREWGVPVRDDRRLFEFLILEGAQAGLSWSTILRKRENYRRALAGFDPARVARFGSRDVRRLLADEGIVRHRGKIEAAIRNARAFLAVQAEHGSFASYLWRFVAGRPQQGRCRARSAPTCDAAGSASWDRRSATRSCRPSASSMTTR